MNYSVVIRLRDWISLDTRSLAIARIALGLSIFLDMLLRLTSVEWHYTDVGLIPRSLAIAGLRPGGFSLFFFSGSESFATVLLILHALAALLLTVGWKTRFMTIINCVLILSLHNRNAYILNGGDMVVRTMLLIAIFLPWGEMWSFDQWKREHKFNSSARVVSGLWVLSLYVTCFVIYFISFLFKIRSPLWVPDFTALSYVMNIYAFANPMGRIISSYEGLLKVTSFLTLLLESVPLFILLFGMVLPRKRWGYTKLFLVILFILFHLSISVFIQIGLFPYYCIALWFAFLPNDFWEKRLKSSHTTFRLERPNWVNEILGGFFVLTTILYSISIYDPFGIKLPTWESIAKVLYLNQNWRMFSSPPQRILWWEIPAELENGEKLELITGEKGEGSKEVSFVNSIPDSHWRKFYGLLIQKPHLRNHYAEALCRTWNRPSDEGGKSPRLKTLAIRLHERPYDTKYQPGKETSSVLLDHQCQ